MGGWPGELSEELCSFSNFSVTSPTSQLIFQHFRRFTYVRAHSPTLPLLHLSHSSFSNPSVASPTSQLILQPFHCFNYVTAHSPTLPSLYLRNSSFSNPSVSSPTSQPILQPFFRFSYVTGSSLTSPGLPPMQGTRITCPCMHQDTAQPLLSIGCVCRPMCCHLACSS